MSQSKRQPPFLRLPLQSTVTFSLLCETETKKVVSSLRHVTFYLTAKGGRGLPNVSSFSLSGFRDLTSCFSLGEGDLTSCFSLLSMGDREDLISCLSLHSLGEGGGPYQLLLSPLQRCPLSVHLSRRPLQLSLRLLHLLCQPQVQKGQQVQKGPSSKTETSQQGHVVITNRGVCQELQLLCAECFRKPIFLVRRTLVAAFLWVRQIPHRQSSLQEQVDWTMTPLELLNRTLPRLRPVLQFSNLRP